ncbi:MAG: DUF2378 family protein [Myxococcaceae bacterium]|nr:DUF2378 family protein [Myxococcaceae bacterium]
MSEKLWFQSAVEGLLLRGVGARLTPALRSRLRELGVDLDHLEPAYPQATMTKAIGVVVDELFADRTREGGLRELGHVFMRGYAETFIGAAMVQIMKVIGPRRTLERMQRNFRNGTNFIETKFEAVGEREATLWFNDVSGMPAFYAGILEEGGRMTGANATVAVESATDASCTFRVSWT